jgi:hypothetical protein
MVPIWVRKMITGSTHWESHWAAMRAVIYFDGIRPIESVDGDRSRPQRRPGRRRGSRLERLTIRFADLEMNAMKTLLILLALVLGFGLSAQAATQPSTTSLNRTQDLSYYYHGRHYRYHHHHHYYHHRRAYYRHGHRYYRYY